MNDTVRELKVGLFVFIAFLLLAVVIFSISDFYTTQPQYTLRVRFNFASGIDVGAPVRLAGVSVGEVKTVRATWDEATQRTYAELGIRLLKEARIEEDSTAYINTLGLIGEKYLELIPGTPGARILRPGEVLAGKDSVPAEQLMESGYRVARQLEETVSSINAVVGDPANREAFKEVLAHSAEASENFNRFLNQANEVMAKIKSGEGTIGRLLTKDDLYEEIKAVVADIKAHPWKLFHRPKEAKKR